jgi:predicted kinase
VVRPVLVILCGLPFSGKSTMGRRLASVTGAELISYDALWQEVRDATGLSCGFDDLSALADARLRAALRSGRDAVYDTLNDTRDWRDRLRALAESAGAGAVVVYLETPLGVRAARRERCRATGERHPVSSKGLKSSEAKFEPPGPDERAVVVRPESPTQARTSANG